MTRREIKKYFDVSGGETGKCCYFSSQMHFDCLWRLVKQCFHGMFCFTISLPFNTRETLVVVKNESIFQCRALKCLLFCGVSCGDFSLWGVGTLTKMSFKLWPAVLQCSATGRLGVFF